MPSSDWRDEIFWWQVWCLGTRLLVTVLVYFVLEILESRFFVGYQNPKDVTKIFTVSTTFKNQLFVTNISVASVNNISPTKTVKSVTKTQTCYHHISTLTPVTNIDVAILTSVNPRNIDRLETDFCHS